MADEGGEFSFFRSIHGRNDISVDISFSIRLMINKFGKQKHLAELTQVRLTK